MLRLNAVGDTAVTILLPYSWEYTLDGFMENKTFILTSVSLIYLLAL